MRDAELVFPQIAEAAMILPNMRGACVTVGNKVHALFRLTALPPARAPLLTQHRLSESSHLLASQS